MRALLNTLQRVPEFQDLLLRIDAGRCPVAASGLSPVHRAFVAAGIARNLERPIVLLCPDEVECAKLSRDLEALLETPVLQLPGREFTFHAAATVSHQWEHKRLAVLKAMARQKAPVVAATVEGFLQRTLPYDKKCWGQRSRPALFFSVQRAKTGTLSASPNVRFFIAPSESLCF